MYQYLCDYTFTYTYLVQLKTQALLRECYIRVSATYIGTISIMYNYTYTNKYNVRYVLYLIIHFLFQKLKNKLNIPYNSLKRDSPNRPRRPQQPLPIHFEGNEFISPTRYSATDNSIRRTSGKTNILKYAINIYEQIMIRSN